MPIDATPGGKFEPPRHDLRDMMGLIFRELAGLNRSSAARQADSH